MLLTARFSHSVLRWPTFHLFLPCLILGHLNHPVPITHTGFLTRTLLTWRFTTTAVCFILLIFTYSFLALPCWSMHCDVINPETSQAVHMLWRGFNSLCPLPLYGYTWWESLLRTYAVHGKLSPCWIFYTITGWGFGSQYIKSIICWHGTSANMAEVLNRNTLTEVHVRKC